MNQQDYINMTGDPALYLSPFSAHQIDIWGRIFPTVEHAYQWKKFSDEIVQQEIYTAKSPLLAWNIAQKYKNKENILDQDFDKDTVMEELFRVKLAQHDDVREILLATQNMEIVKVHTEDYYWGIGKDGTGKNFMGRLWMKLRQETISNVTK